MNQPIQSFPSSLPLHLLSEMEYAVAARALRPRLLGEFAMKSAQQALFDEHLCATGVTSEDFSVDDLLDLSNAELGGGYVEEEEEEEEGEVERDSLSGSSSPDQADDYNSNSANFSGATESVTIQTPPISLAPPSPSLIASELAVPDDDVAELEWLSYFVPDESTMRLAV